MESSERMRMSRRSAQNETDRQQQDRQQVDSRLGQRRNSLGSGCPPPPLNFGGGGRTDGRQKKWVAGEWTDVAGDWGIGWDWDGDGFRGQWTDDGREGTGENQLSAAASILLAWLNCWLILDNISPLTSAASRPSFAFSVSE